MVLYGVFIVSVLANIIYPCSAGGFLVYSLSVIRLRLADGGSQVFIKDDQALLIILGNPQCGKAEAQQRQKHPADVGKAQAKKTCFVVPHQFSAVPECMENMDGINAVNQKIVGQGQRQHQDDQNNASDDRQHGADDGQGKAG